MFGDVKKIDLSDCRCTNCAAQRLRVTQPIDPQSVQPNAIVCEQCGTEFDVIYGVPYLLMLEERDFLALVEIAGEYDSPQYQLDNFTPYDDSWPRILAACKEAPDYEAYKASIPSEYAAGLDDRFDQWRMLDIISGNVDLTRKKVLVVGAGLGFDSNLLAFRGADITAVDLNPQTNSIGVRQLPKARWIGALGRRLPFIDASFDHVFISASLHHVLDVSATLLEMLRVVKIGGSVFTTNDSHSADITTDLDDARFWNDHPDVLRGINENTPRLKVYIDPLLDHADQLDIEFWTHRAFGFYVEEEKRRRDFLDPLRWDLLKYHKLLRETAGGVFMRITPNSQISVPFTAPTRPIVTPAELFAFVGRKSEAMAHIAHFTPSNYLSPPFPGPPGNTKFQVLNGWRWTEPGEQGRDAYMSGRWYVRRPKHRKKLVVSAGPPSCEAAARISVTVDGSIRAEKICRGGRSVKFVINVADTPAETPVAVEVSFSSKSTEMTQKLLHVERIDFT